MQKNAQCFETQVHISDFLDTNNTNDKTFCDIAVFLTFEDCLVSSALVGTLKKRKGDARSKKNKMSRFSTASRAAIVKERENGDA